jgi:serine/threonine protein kinase
MASVLLCQDERLDRQVAVKRLHADSPDDVERRFLREAKLGASLNHPNLVSVFDTATDDEGVLIVMEYVEGEPLSRRLKRGPLEPERVAGMVHDLGEALEHAHSQGVVHRDVKPGNVLLREDGATKLVDLGIATAADQTRITHSGVVLGTAAYMAPEQLEGGEAGPPADVYAFAALAYEALTGQRARAGRSPVEIAHQIATRPPPDLREALPGAPAAAAEVLKRAMARDPAERPTAGELGRELAGALAPEPEPRRSTHRFTRPTHPLPLAAAAPEEPTTGPGRPATVPARSLTSRHRARKRPVAGILVALLILAMAAAVAATALLSSGDGDDSGGNAGSQEQAGSGAGKEKAKKQKKEKQNQQAAEQDQPAQSAPPPASEQEQPEQSEQASQDAASGVELNEQGFARMQQGDYAGAVPILQQAVASWPEDSRDLNYAYALFNLGKSLNRSGQPDEAIPYLEKRLTWDDQRETVQAELDLARRNAGQE